MAATTTPSIRVFVACSGCAATFLVTRARKACSACKPTKTLLKRLHSSARKTSTYVQNLNLANTTRTGSVHRSSRHHRPKCLSTLPRVATLKSLSRSKPRWVTSPSGAVALSSRSSFDIPRRPFRRQHSLRLPAEALNGSRLPRRAGARRKLLTLFRLSPETPPALSRCFYLGHTPSPKDSLFAATRREPPRTSFGPSPISDTHRVGSQVARASCTLV
jgi:hypothetical protein